MKTKEFIYLRIPKPLGRRFLPYDRNLLEKQAQELFRRIERQQNFPWPRAEEKELPWPLGAFDPGL